MSHNGGMKGWQAVPIVIPSFLIISIATIWYFSFHHFKDRPRQQSFTSPINSSSRSQRSVNTVSGPPNHDHLVHLVDIPPIPTKACSKEQQHGSPAPGSALRAQRGRGSLHSARNRGRTCGGDNPALTGEVVNSDELTTPKSTHQNSYVIDSGTPPPIPAAHLRSPIPYKGSSERPTPLTPMNTLPSGKKREPALQSKLVSEATCSSPCWHSAAFLGLANERDPTVVAEQSAVLTETPSLGTLGLPNTTTRGPPHQKPVAVYKPKKIFIVNNPNSIFPSIKCELNPAAANPVASDLAEEMHEEASITSGRSYVHSLTMSIRSFLLAHPSPPSTHITDPKSFQHHRKQPRLSISGPSLYTFERRTPDWSITESDVYRSASRITKPLIDHPDLEKGFQRPNEWGEKTADLIEAETISGQMRSIDQLKEKRLGKLPVGQGGEKHVIARDHDGDAEYRTTG